MKNLELERAKTVILRVAVIAAAVLLIWALSLYFVFAISRTIFFAGSIFCLFLLTNFKLAKIVRAKIKTRFGKLSSQKDTSQNGHN